MRKLLSENRNDSPPLEGQEISQQEYQPRIPTPRWLKGLMVAVIAVLFGFALLIWWNSHKTTHATLTQGLIGYWSFDSNSVSKNHVKDISGNGNDGSMTSRPDLVTGKIGQALQFNDRNRYVDLGSQALINNLHALSFSAWVYPIAGSGEERIIDKGGINSSGWLVNLNNSAKNWHFIAYFTGGSVERSNDYNTTEHDMWQHIVVTWDGSATGTNVKMYVNGEETAYRSTFDGSGSRNDDATYHLYLGDASSLIPYNGLIDEVRIYNRVLSADEVKELYNMAR